MSIQNIKKILTQAFGVFAAFRLKNKEIAKQADCILAEAVRRSDAQKINRVKKNIGRLS